MKYDLVKYLLTALIGATVTSVFAYLKYLSMKLKENKDKDRSEEKAVNEAVKILLRAELKRNCQYYIETGTITAPEYEELTEELKVYEALGGNGLVHRLYESVQDIEIT